MNFTFKVIKAKGSDEFIRFIKKLDFIVPVKKKKSKKNSNIIPAKNPNGNPLMIIGAFDHIKDIKSFRKSIWKEPIL